MTPSELLQACINAQSQGLDFLPLVLRKAKRSDGYQVRALGQLCEVLCVNSDENLVIRASAKKTIKWLKRELAKMEKEDDSQR